MLSNSKSVHLLWVLITVFSACGSISKDSFLEKSVKPSGVITEKIIEISDFNSLSLANGFKYCYSHTDGPLKIKISGSDNIIELIEAQVSKGDLNIGLPSNTNINGKNDVAVYIEGRHVSSFTTLAGAQLFVNCAINCNEDIKIESFSGADIVFNEPVSTKHDVNIECYSGADVKLMRLKADKVKMETYSAGGITTGECKAKSMKLESYSAGRIKLNGTVCEKINAEAYSAGTISVNGTNLGEITAEAYSVGRIKIKGADTIVKTKKSSGGSVSVEKNGNH